MQNLIRMFYDPNPGPGGTTLADLDNPNFKSAKTDPPDLSEEQRLQAEADTKAEADRLAALGTGGETEGLDAEGNLLEGYIKDAEGKVVKDPDFKPADTNDDPLTFWADVDKLRGTPLVVEFPDGVDPISPEGVLIREKAVAQEAMDKFEHYLATADPRSYAYMLHRQAGGDDESFFAQKTFALPDYEVFKGSAEIQATTYRSSLLSKGLDPESVTVLVDKAIKDGKLFDFADNAYKAAKTQYQKDLDNIKTKTEESEREYQGRVNNMNQVLTSLVNEGKDMSFIIPDTDKIPFLNFVRSSLEYENGQFVIVQRIEDVTKTAKQLEALFFLYKKGDLSKLIQRSATTLAAKRLGQNAKKANTGASGSEPPANVKSKNKPLGEL